MFLTDSPAPTPLSEESLQYITTTALVLLSAGRAGGHARATLRRQGCECRCSLTRGRLDLIYTRLLTVQYRASKAKELCTAGDGSPADGHRVEQTDGIRAHCQWPCLHPAQREYDGIGRCRGTVKLQGSSASSVSAASSNCPALPAPLAATQICATKAKLSFGNGLEVAARQAKPEAQQASRQCSSVFVALIFVALAFTIENTTAVVTRALDKEGEKRGTSEPGVQFGVVKG